VAPSSSRGVHDHLFGTLPVTPCQPPFTGAWVQKHFENVHAISLGHGTPREEGLPTGYSVSVGRLGGAGCIKTSLCLLLLFRSDRGVFGPERTPLQPSHLLFPPRPCPCGRNPKVPASSAPYFVRSLFLCPRRKPPHPHLGVCRKQLFLFTPRTIPPPLVTETSQSVFTVGSCTYPAAVSPASLASQGFLFHRWLFFLCPAFFSVRAPGPP